ncbi:MAG: AMP-binding protein, partial [Pseudomonadota bacterium]|nr:AMP-binding protein [Pseudomonadota bacterium]
MAAQIFEDGLGRNAANFAPLSPLPFLERAATVFPALPAVIHGSGASALRFTWSELYARCRRLASALSQHGVGRGDTAAVMLPNTPAMVEAHFGIPMTGAVLNALNTRLDPASVSFQLSHGEAKVLITDREFAPTIEAALACMDRELTVINVDDPVYDGPGQLIGTLDYESFLGRGSADYVALAPADEWDAIALNYTSGTTGNPKGVVYSPRGAYTNAVSNVLVWAMPHHPVYL